MPGFYATVNRVSLLLARRALVPTKRLLTDRLVAKQLSLSSLFLRQRLLTCTVATLYPNISHRELLAAKLTTSSWKAETISYTELATKLQQ